MKREVNWGLILEESQRVGLKSYIELGIRLGLLKDMGSTIEFIRTEVLFWLETEERYEDAQWLVNEIKGIEV